MASILAHRTVRVDMLHSFSFEKGVLQLPFCPVSCDPWRSSETIQKGSRNTDLKKPLTSSWQQGMAGNGRGWELPAVLGCSCSGTPGLLAALRCWQWLSSPRLGWHTSAQAGQVASSALQELQALCELSFCHLGCTAEPGGDGCNWRWNLLTPENHSVKQLQVLQGEEYGIT